MSWVYLVIMLVAVLLLILSLTPIRLRLKYQKRGKDDLFALEFSLWRGIIFYKLEIPVVKMEVAKPKPGLKPRPLHWLLPRPAFKIKSEIEGKKGRPIAGKKKKIPMPGPAGLIKIVSDAVHKVKKYYPAIMYLLKQVHLRRLRWRTEIGTGDPAQTGFLTGLVWGFKGFLLTFFYRLFSPGGAGPVVAVTPSFEKACFNTMLDCIFEVRIGYIIVTGFKALLLRFK